MTELRFPLDVRDGVLVGRDDELYLAGGAHSILKFAQGEKLPRSTLDRLAANLLRRQDLASKHDALFAHLIAPEKYMVYGDAFPIASPGSMAQQYFDLGYEGAIYPIDLLAAGGEGRTYFKTDTHWTPWALARISRLVASEGGLATDHADAVDTRIREAIRITDHIFYGDLGRKFDPKAGEPRPDLTIAPAARRHENGVAHDYASPVNDGRMVLMESQEAGAAKTLLIFGDSYLFHALPYLAFYFKRVVFLRTRYFHEDVAAMVRPDLIVSQMAERYLSRIDLDETAPPFWFMPQLLDRTPTMTAAAARAFSVAFSGGRGVDFKVFDKAIELRKG